MKDWQKFDGFTQQARKVISLAQEEAQRFRHNYIGTEHLLLGLVRQDEGVAIKVLTNLGVELGEVRQAVEFIIGTGDRIVLGDIGLTPRTKKVIELAIDEARHFNHQSVGTEHLLLGLVREGEGIAAGILKSLGVNLEKVRTQTIRMLNQVGSVSMEDVVAPGLQQTAAAKKVYKLAQEEAQRLQQNAIGTQHLLLGLMREGDGIAASVLSKLGVELEKLRSTIEAICKRGDQIGSGPIVLNQLAIEVLVGANLEARALSHDSIDTEHLLLGLIRLEESFAAAALQSLNVKLEQIRPSVMEALKQTQS